MAPGIPSDFDSLAVDYARFRTAYSTALFDNILDYARLPAGARVLDLACGTGLGMLPYLERGFAVCGVDVAPRMIEVARRELERRFATHFVLGRAEQLPLDDGSFDLVSCAQAFHWFDAQRAFGECARVLRRGGALAIFWKHAARDDPYTLAVEDLIHEWFGEEAAVRSRDHADEHAGHWDAFWRSVSPAAGDVSSVGNPPPIFVQGEKRISSFVLKRSVADFVGYQRSREKIRMVVGERRHEFLETLERRLRALALDAETFEQRQDEFLFLARRP
ncbi:MAG: class I SAM-dependent methyltransferase [Candidatus Eremiobacteraeota bacterium]|nr:class I SAM-dependent methyltransferase [Candidatus Eremiobacteraeota bacterium]